MMLAIWAKTRVKARAAREGGRTSIGSGGLPLCSGLAEDSSSLLTWVLGLVKGGGDVCRGDVLIGHYW